MGCVEVIAVVARGTGAISGLNRIKMIACGRGAGEATGEAHHRES